MTRQAAAPRLETPESRVEPLRTPEAPRICIRCGAIEADVFDGDVGPVCGSGCLELLRMGR